MENKLRINLKPFNFQINHDLINVQNLGNILSQDLISIIYFIKNEKFENFNLNENEKKLTILYQLFLQYIDYTQNHLNEKKNYLITLLDIQNIVLNKSSKILSKQIDDINLLKNRIENISNNIMNIEYLHKFLDSNKNKEEDIYENDQSDGEIII